MVGNLDCHGKTRIYNGIGYGWQTVPCNRPPMIIPHKLQVVFFEQVV
jgi:hypothetical protein